MPGLQTGVVAAADVNSQPTSKDGIMRTAAGWSTIWFVVSTVYLLGLYYGMIRLHGSGDNL